MFREPVVLVKPTRNVAPMSREWSLGSHAKKGGAESYPTVESEPRPYSNGQLALRPILF
jgi:hypothetical protein